MTATPTVGVSKYFIIDTSGNLKAVSSKYAGEGERCGGNMTTAPVCMPGLQCAPAPGSHLPFGDVGGTCVALQGSLSGSMTIGPMCPVENAANPCTPTAETYAAHKVYVYDSSRQKLLATLTPDAQGNFSTKLDPGTYIVDVEHQAVGGVQGAPATVKISAGATATVKISIDTGIR